MIQRISQMKQRPEAGFTLIELLVVIVILGVLSGVVVFAVGGIDDRGEDSAYEMDARTLKTAEEAYHAKFATYGTEAQLAGVDPAPDGQRYRFLGEESAYHGIELDAAAGTYTIVSDLGYGGVPLPMADQNLTVGYKGDPWTNSKVRLSRFALDAGTCETLTKVNNDYSVGPRLATSWELINPGNNPAYPGKPTWRFRLRPGVKFHRGGDFTAADVKHSMDRLVSLGDDFTAKLGTSSTVVVDPLTVDITPVEANFRLPEIVVHPTYGIIANGTQPQSNLTSTPGGWNVDCTGPFKFKEYVQGDRIVVERNAGYWGAKAKLNQITFKFIPDATTRRLALEAGTIDAMYDVGRHQVAGLRANSDLQVVSAPVSYVFNLYMNVNGVDAAYDELQSPNVRRALALSIDRQDFVDQNWEPGIATVVNTPSPPSILGSHASMNTGFTYNLDEAKQLLADDGWVCTGASAPACADGEIRQKNGEPLDLYMLSQTNNPDDPLLQDIRQRARGAGIQITIGGTQNGTQRSERKNQGLWDLDHTNPNQNDANPAFLLTLQWWSKSISPWVRWQQAGPAFDSLVEAALASPTIDGTRNFSAQAMDLLVDQDAKVIPLAGLSRVYGLRDGLEGFEPPHPAESLLSWAGVYRTM